jgi:hypothetical protein
VTEVQGCRQNLWYRERAPCRFNSPFGFVLIDIGLPVGEGHHAEGRLEISNQAMMMMVMVMMTSRRREIGNQQPGDDDIMMVMMT